MNGDIEPDAHDSSLVQRRGPVRLLEADHGDGGGMSDAQHNATQILKRWVLDLQLGNGPTPEAWTEIRETIDRMPEDEREAMRTIALDFLNEFDHEN